jgi:hypothetical protein
MKKKLPCAVAICPLKTVTQTERALAISQKLPYFTPTNNPQLMPHDLTTFNSILHLHLRPWKATESEQKFRQLLHSLAKENYHHQPLYEVAFPKPLTDKTRYYKALVDNDAVTFLNKMDADLATAINANEKKFYVHKALTKKLKGLLEDTQKVIVKQQLYFKTFEDPEQDKQLRDNAWIIQYLKYQLIRLYLEIQDQYAGFLKEEPVTEEDLHLLYFSENNAGRKLITNVTIRELKKSGNKTVSQEEVEFTPVKGEVRESGSKIFTYQEIVADSNKFAQIEILLYKDQLIDLEYNFVKKKGNVQKLAAFYQVLIKKRYFNQLSFPGKKEITALHIRKFLNYRYKATIDKEFRNFNNPELLEEYLINNPGCELFPSC